jgi:two-component system, OmpR family, sensor kinase
MLSLRWRLVAVALGVASIGLITANLVVFGVVRRDLNDRIDRQLKDFSGRRLLVGRNLPASRTRSTAPGAPGAAQSGPSASFPPRPPRSAFETYAELRDASGLLLATPQRFSAAEEGSRTPAPLDLPKTLGRPPASPRIFETDDASGKPYRVIYRALPTDLKRDNAEGLIFAIPAVDRDATLAKLRRVQWVAVLATLAALALFASLLVRLGLRPLRRIEKSAATIAGGDLSHRIVDLGSPRTEVGRLGASLNVMLSQIEGAFEEKERSESQLKRFIANASHELRTPLTSIRGYAELYQRGVARSGPVLDNAMDRIASEAGRMGALVEDMLALARFEQAPKPSPEPVDLESVVHQAANDYRVVDGSRPVTVTVNASPWVSADGNAIMQILTNLLGNVRTHTPVGTRVDIALSEDGGFAVLNVSDNGPGIGSSELPLIFEAFYRTDPSRSRSKGGAGLGLAIVAGIVERNGGTISVDSAPGKGTTFIIRFPRIADPSVHEPAGGQATPTTTPSARPGDRKFMAGS